MGKIFDKLHYHGKTVYRHAQKHHKKYLWGVAGFFGLFKLFSFLIVSIFTYTIASANISSILEIPAVIIDIQDGKKILQFDLSAIDTGSQDEILDIALHMDMATKKKSIDMETLRNNTNMSLGQTNVSLILGLRSKKTEENIRYVDAENIPGIMEQVTIGNTIVYFLPQEDMEFKGDEIFMEIGLSQSEEVQQPESSGDNEEQPEFIDTGNVDTGIDCGIYDKRDCKDQESCNRNKESGICEIIIVDPGTGNEEIQCNNYEKKKECEIQIDCLRNKESRLCETMQIDTGIRCDDYEKKKDCENQSECLRDTKHKLCESREIINVQEKYEFMIQDPDSDIIVTAPEIRVHSDKRTQRINGELKIPKGKKMKKDIADPGDAIIQFDAPTLVIDTGLQGTVPKEGIPGNFVHIETIQVGDPNIHVTTLGTGNFTISIEITDVLVIPGTILHIYSSSDGSVWENLGTTCMVDDLKMCEFITPHLSLFALGTIIRNNMEFVTQRFRDQNPTTGQIIDAFYGTGGNRSVYNVHRFNPPSTACRPTNVVFRTSGTRGATTLSANTMYVLEGGSYIQTGTLTFGGACIAVVGSGAVTITKDFAGNLFSAVRGKVIKPQELILDNLQLDGSGNTSPLVNFTNIPQTTFNDIQAYNNDGVGLYIDGGVDTVINNTQVFNNSSIGIHLLGGTTKFSVINNSQIYNNGSYGIEQDNAVESVINNTQVYNNASYGIYANSCTTLIINNSQIYNNNDIGIYLTTSPDVRIHNLKVFKNTTSQFNFSIGSSGLYFGQNIVYPTPNMGNFSTGSSNSTLRWDAGSVASTDRGFSCSFVTNPKNGFGTGLYTTSDCSDIGRITARSHQPTVKYLYGNDMTGGKYVSRQIVPVRRLNDGLTMNDQLLRFTDMPFHGQRFIGEYYNPNGNDINTPVVFFTGSTPAQGYNVLNTAYFTVKSYIYESFLNIAKWYENINGSTTYTQTYDSGLVLMMNFDNVLELGETTGVIIKDRSMQNNHGNATNSPERTGNGKRNGAYEFDGASEYIQISSVISAINSGNNSVCFRTKPIDFKTYDEIFTQVGSSQEFRLEFFSNGYFGYTTRVGSYKQVYSTAPIQTGVRTHICAVRSGTVGSIYINGAFNASGEIQDINTTTTPCIGNYCGAGLYYSGQLDEFRIYDRTLSSDDIALLYRSNLSVAADHREFVVNYTGVNAWSYGTHTYGRMGSTGVIDNDDNGITLTGSVRKADDCMTGRDNSNFLTSGFRNNSPAPTSGNIICALYGTGEGDLTAYTQHRSGRNSSQCSGVNINVVYTGNLSITGLSANTIYVLTGQTTTGSWTINMANCSAIVSNQATGTIFYSTTGLDTDAMIAISSNYAILDNISVNGTGGGPVPAHPRNQIGIDIRSTENSTINNSKTYSSKYGISSEGGANTILMNSIETYDNDYGITISSKGSQQSDNIMNDIQAHNNIKDGIIISEATNHILTGIKTYDNGGDGIAISIMTDTIVINNLQSYNNNNGISYDSSESDILVDAWIHSNTGAGIYIKGANDHITFNNIQSYNNGYGFLANNDAYNKDYIAINNSQIYNSSGDGMLLYRTNYFTVNNCHIYNNSGNGINFASTLNDSGIFNTTLIYNNASFGIYSRGTHKYYGTLKTFDNTAGNIYLANGTVDAGSASTYSSIGRTGGTLDTVGCMNCSQATVGLNSTNGVHLIDTSIYKKCEMKGKNLSWSGGSEVRYKYGTNIAKQKEPVYRSSTTLTNAATPTLTYDTSKYVAETSNIGSYNNAQCSCTNHTYRRDNSTYITGSFRSHNPAPNNCDVVAALYGTGLSGLDTTAYTTNRSSARSGQCNTENTEVLFLTGGTGKIDLIMPQNTIYVLDSGNYIQTGQINLNNCVGIVGKNQGATLRSTEYLSLTTFYAVGMQNMIFDNITMNGTGGGPVPAHKANNCGIYFSVYSNNNTINSNQIYNNDNVGILLANGSKNVINDNHVYNNYDGIYLYGADYNIVENNYTHNNSNYGIRLGYLGNNTIRSNETHNNSCGMYLLNSPNNNINNNQIYNNSNGIFWQDSAFTTYNNINNNQVYNNYIGLYLHSASGFAINNNQIYNNIYGLYLYYSQNSRINNNQMYNNYCGVASAYSPDNKYYGTNLIFANTLNSIETGSLLTGSSSDFPGLGRNDGMFIITTGTMSRDYVTNPISTNNYHFLPWTSSRAGIQGQQSRYNTSITDRFSYGSGILTQAQPVLNSGTTLITGDVFDPTKYIGSDVIKVTGDLLGVPAFVTGISLTVTGISSDALINTYSLSGNITKNITDISINTSTGITLVTGLSTNRIITQLYFLVDDGGDDAGENTYGYFATHFEKDTNYDLTAPITTDDANNTRRNTDMLVTLTPNEPSTTYYCVDVIGSCVPNITGTSVNVTCTSGTTCPSQYVSYYSIDGAGNIESTKISAQIRIDKQGPAFTFANSSGYECTAGTLTITSATDGGVGLHATPYSFDNSIRDTSASTGIAAQQPGSQDRTGRVRDALINTTTHTATYTFNDIAPTADDFTGHSNVGVSAKTADRMVMGNVAEGSCGTGDILYSGMVTQGTKGTCSVSGNNITYTPDEGQVGSDYCIMQIKDNEDSTVDITVYRGGINSMPPSIYFTGSTPISGETIVRNSFTPQIEIINAQYMNTFNYILNNVTYPYFDSGLVLMMNFDNVAALGESAGETIKDVSIYGNHGTGMNAPTRIASGRRNGAYQFDGANDYIQFSGAFPAVNSPNNTICFRVNPMNYKSYDEIFVQAVPYQEFRLEFGSDGIFWYTTRIGGYKQVYSSSPIQTGIWTNICAVRSGTVGNIYINGVFNASGEIHDINTTTNACIGNYCGVSLYYTGQLDEFRIYDRTLSSDEIHQMRRSNLTKYDTDKRRFTDDKQCLADGNYIYTGYAVNEGGLSNATGRMTNVNIQNPTPYAPSGYFIGSTGISLDEIITLSGQFTGYFKMEDREGTTGRYTTIMLPLRLSGVNLNTNYIDRTNIKFMATGVDSISGTDTSDIYMNPSLNTYNSFNSAQNYIIRDTVTEEYYCPAGIYGNKPYISVDIPAFQNPDIYSGIITIDFNE